MVTINTQSMVDELDLNNFTEKSNITQNENTDELLIKID